MKKSNRQTDKQIDRSKEKMTEILSLRVCTKKRLVVQVHFNGRKLRKRYKDKRE